MVIGGTPRYVKWLADANEPPIGAMLEALLENKLNTEDVADLARGSLRRKIPQIVEALEGHRMSDHHRLLIRQALNPYAVYRRDDRRTRPADSGKTRSLPKAGRISLYGSWD